MERTLSSTSINKPKWRQHNMSISNTTPIPNFVLDVSLPTLKPVELKVLLVILRQTHGWQKQADWISMRQFCQKTGCSRRAISTAIQSLEDKQWIQVENRSRKRHFLPSNERFFPPKREKSSRRLRRIVRPTKDTLTRETCTRGKKCPSDKVRSIREILQAEGILPPVEGQANA